MTKSLLVLNGPNLNMLGVREPEIYGSETLADVEAACRGLTDSLDLTLDFRQSNHEGVLIDAIQEARDTSCGIVVNPAAFTHTSIALLDALSMFDGPVIEVHLSNIHKREPWRHTSYVSYRADGVIAGCGTQGYLLAILRISQMISDD